MSLELPPHHREEIEAKVTALLLGELTAEEAEAVRRQIAQDAELGRLHQRLQKTLELVREMAATPVEEAPAPHAPLKLSEGRREQLLAHFKTVKMEKAAPGRTKWRRWVLGMAAAAVLALVVILGMPNFVKSRTTPQRNAIINDLRLFDSAKQQWALEQRKSATDTPTMDDLQPYVGRGERGEVPSAPGVTFRLGSVGEAPVAVLHDRWSKDETAIVTIDGGAPPLGGGRVPTLGIEMPAPSPSSVETPPVATAAPTAGSSATKNPFVGNYAYLPAPAAPTTGVVRDYRAMGSRSANESAADDLEARSRAEKATASAAMPPPASYDQPATIAGTTSPATTVVLPSAPVPEQALASVARRGAGQVGSAAFAGGHGESVTNELAVNGNSVLESDGIVLPHENGFESRQTATPPPDDSDDFKAFAARHGLVTHTTTDATVARATPDSAGKLALPVDKNSRRASPVTDAGVGGGGGGGVGGLFGGPRSEFANNLQFEEFKKLDASAASPQVAAGAVNALQEKTKVSPGVGGAAPSGQFPGPAGPSEVQTRENAFSTFSLNVSDASFRLAGASLQNGVMPPAAGIRSEEFINAFDYRDPEPAPGAPIGFAWERAGDPFAQNRDFLRFSLKTMAQGREAGRPLNVVLLLDKSGSMERADRVAITHEALRVLGRELQAQDTLSVVVFARTARLWVDGVAGDKTAKVAGDLDGVTPEGGTNLGEAMKLAYATALRHYLANGENRVVLLTDGAANLGEVDADILKKQAVDNRKQGIALDCFGVGWDGYNDSLLETLARSGNGRYGFLNTPEEAATEFAGKLAGALRVAAADVKVQVEFNPNRVTAYRQIGYAHHQLTREQFRDNTVTAAQLGAAESGNALYAVEVNPAGDGPLCTVRVRFRAPGTSDYQERAWEVPYTGSAAPLDKASPAMRLAAVAAEFAEWLGSSPGAGDVTPERLLVYLTGVPEVYGADGRPKELQWMIRQAQRLK